MIKRICLVLFMLIAIPAFAEPIRTLGGSPDGPMDPMVRADIERRIEAAKEIARRIGPQFSIAGVLEKGQKSKYSINGEDFEIGESTTIQGDLRLGSVASVQGDLLSGGEKRANTVVVNPPANASQNISSSEFERNR